MYILHKLHKDFIDEKNALDLPVGVGDTYHAQLLHANPHIRRIFFWRIGIIEQLELGCR